MAFVSLIWHTSTQLVSASEVECSRYMSLQLHRAIYGTCHIYTAADGQIAGFQLTAVLTKKLTKIKLYTVSHNYGNPRFLLYSFWINRHKVIKFSTYPVCLVGLVNAVTFAKTHYWLNVCSKCPPFALMHVWRCVCHCLIAASIMRWSISSQAVRICARSSSMSLICFL